MRNAILILLTLATMAQARPRRFGISQTEQVTKGLVSYWSMRNSGTTVYDEIGPNNGTTTGSPTFEYANGLVGQGVGFDGTNDYIVVGDSDSLDIGTSDFSVTMWIKTATASTAGAFRLINKRSGTRGYEIYIENGETRISALMGDPSGFVFGALGSDSVRDTVWHHLVVVFDRSASMVAYVDGDVQSIPRSISARTGSLATAVGLNIGATQTGTNPLNGSIDEVRIYNRALTLVEIKQLYRMGKVIYQNR